MQNSWLWRCFFLFKFDKKPSVNEDCEGTLNSLGNANACEQWSSEQATVNERHASWCCAYIALQLLEQLPMSSTKKRVSQMIPVQCSAGNTTQCQTPQVLKQAVHEARDPIKEMEIQRRAWFTFSRRKHFHCYIQAIWKYPLSVNFFMERQIERHIAHSEFGNCEIHVDATGSVTSTVGEKRLEFTGLR